MALEITGIKLLDELGLNLAKSEVFNRFKTMRARIFFEGFCEHINNADFDNLPKKELVKKFDKLFSKEEYLEYFYENYRRSLFSASKKIGPRVLSIITARLINEDREPTEFEERFCLACEVLNDRYLRAFKIDFENKVKENEEKGSKNLSTVFLHTDVVHSIGTGMNKSSKPLYLLSLMNCGIVEESIMATSIPSQGGAGPQIANTMTSYHFQVSTYYKDLIKLIDFATFY